jgi:hypothetical protein
VVSETDPASLQPDPSQDDRSGRERSQKEARTDASSANYEFRLVGTGNVRWAKRLCWKSSRAKKVLIEGRIWVDAEVRHYPR